MPGEHPPCWASHWAVAPVSLWGSVVWRQTWVALPCIRDDRLCVHGNIIPSLATHHPRIPLCFRYVSDTKKAERMSTCQIGEFSPCWKCALKFFGFYAIKRKNVVKNAHSDFPATRVRACFQPQIGLGTDYKRTLPVRKIAQDVERIPRWLRLLCLAPYRLIAHLELRHMSQTEWNDHTF